MNLPPTAKAVRRALGGLLVAAVIGVGLAIPVLAASGALSAPGEPTSRGSAGPLVSIANPVSGQGSISALVTVAGGPDSDGDGFMDEAESGTPLCNNGANEDDFDDAIADDGCLGGPPQAGSFSEGQFNLGTTSLGGCQADRPFGSIPSTHWPLDLHGGNEILDSRNLINISDLTAFLAPIRRLDTSPGDANFDQRYDMKPGPDPIIAGDWIDGVDFAALLAGGTGFPEMLNFARAMDGPACTP